MKRDDLKVNDTVIFKRYSDILKEETFQDGHVLFVIPEQKLVSICWLEGYKSRAKEIPYEKVIAKHDVRGEVMKFGIYSGNSILLTD